MLRYTLDWALYSSILVRRFEHHFHLRRAENSNHSIGGPGLSGVQNIWDDGDLYLNFTGPCAPFSLLDYVL